MKTNRKTVILSQRLRRGGGGVVNPPHLQPYCYMLVGIGPNLEPENLCHQTSSQFLR